MDIDILLALQDFRESAGGVLANLMTFITFLGELNTVLFIMAAVYWAVSKDLGTYLLMGWSGNRLANGLLKITFCAYRPWIRDPRILPYGDSMTTATGYSFPSGHTMNAATVYGGAAFRRDVPKLLRFIGGALVVLVAFSRNYLGVHTPQDVLAGTVCGVVVMALILRLMRYIAEHPEKDILVVCVGVALAALLALYAALKPYPKDYNAEGKLIVDGARMAADTFKGVGWCAAFLTGWILERRFIKFTTDVSVSRRLLRFAFGMAGLAAITLWLMPLMKAAIPGPMGSVLGCFIQMLYVAAGFPWLEKLAVSAVKKEETAK